MREYIAVTLLACVLALGFILYVVNPIANAMDNMANTIAEGPRS